MGLNNTVSRLESSWKRMNDVSQLTDEQLEEIVNSTDELVPDMSHLSDDELRSIARGERGLNTDENARAKP